MFIYHSFNLLSFFIQYSFLFFFFFFHLSYFCMAWRTCVGRGNRRLYLIFLVLSALFLSHFFILSLTSHYHGICKESAGPRSAGFFSSVSFIFFGFFTFSFRCEFLKFIAKRNFIVLICWIPILLFIAFYFISCYLRVIYFLFFNLVQLLNFCFLPSFFRFTFFSLLSSVWRWSYQTRSLLLG